MGASASAITTRSRRAGLAAADRSERGEERALRACRRLPWWCLGATRTRHHSQLDRWGIDIVIETVDLGRIVLQVKSSEHRAAEFREYGKRLALRYRIHTIVIDDSLCDAEVYGRILGVCIVAREEAEAAGLTCDDARLCRKEAA